MIIGFDISMLMYEGSGVATYTKNFVLSMLRYYPKHSYKLFYSSLRKPDAFKVFKHKVKKRAKLCTYHLPPRVFNYLWTKQHFFSVNNLIGQTDIYFSPDFLRPPLNKHTKGITTIHDLTWKKFPKLHTQNIVTLHEEKLRKTILHNDLIITDSNNTTNDLFYYFPSIPRRNVKRIYPGIDEIYKRVSNEKKIQKVFEHYGLIYPCNYILYVGAIEPRKNLRTAINTYAKLIRRKGYNDFKFIIIGRAGWKNENVLNLIKKLKLEEKIIFLGFVPIKDLPTFYSAAKANIYLSLYEGFGLPPLEAARCGTPSLIYKNSSLKETFPKNYPFAQKNKEVNKLVYLIRHKKNINYSFSKKYTWEKYCHQFMKFIQA